ncbi:metal ABC transporter permease [Formicincola oecophyllae]|uniref:High-affinity zinc uptake system membrane protein ZnuB n=2 Tax=Formicincola oecophyllae TaxID=2558361 RepID=A0A4Y6UD53_9PROT|nr:metal ABC transporter permease [Formicincola oecophyllae]QDH14367.1 metal ABC transporter permease [Formicincola oecophyllae]
MFDYDFMRLAFAGTTLVALMAGPVGWFLLLRRQAFAAHALPHAGFAGAGAAVWLGCAPLLGMVSATVLAGLAMACESPEPHNPFAPIRRDAMTGLVLTASLGIGLWCLHRANGMASQATNLLFGDVLGLTLGSLELLAGVLVASFALMGFLWRPLLFASISPVQAAARGVPMRLVGLLFMLAASLTAAASSVVAGALLSFSLMIGPAAAALRLQLAPVPGVLFATMSALLLSWGGLALSWQDDAPVAFWIALGAVGLYAGSCLFMRLTSHKRGVAVRGEAP